MIHENIIIKRYDTLLIFLVVILATVDGNCCFKLFQKTYRRGRSLIVTPGFDGMPDIDFELRYDFQSIQNKRSNELHKNELVT